MIIIKHHGNFDKTEKFLRKASRLNLIDILIRYGREGVSALSSATPIDTGNTANSWDYNIKINKNKYQINWTNSNVVDGVPIAIILQYGHGTKNGAYVEGIDYINPAIQPIFKKMADDIWKEVTKT